jgi:acetylornithine deacetylase/succinyl-diaminopimelate desuccinylase-like protein
LFEGCNESVGEAGGFSQDLGGRRACYVQVAEKWFTWFRLTARGPGGHGSLIHPANPIARLCEALLRVQGYVSPYRPIDSTKAVVAAAQERTGQQDPDAALDAIGPVGRLLRPVLRNTYSITRLAAGSQHNVVPPEAAAAIDGRYVPGFADELLAEIRQLAGDLVDVEVVNAGPAVQAPFEGAVPDAIVAAVGKQGPAAEVIPVCLPIGTDGKHFARLGIRNFGFAPLPLPAGFDFAAMFHGTDERVPVSALTAGTPILKDFFAEF